MLRYLQHNYSFHHDGEEREYLMWLKKNKLSYDEVDSIVEKNLKLAEHYINSYTIEPVWNAKYRLIEFSRDVIYQYIYAGIANDFNSTNAKRKWKSSFESNQLEDSTSETTSEP